ncbi:MAG TPA: 16S rRNA (adenine(1518)-N(6)/adenine(1519)-N(6))-dimethyltransferase RsmA [Alphaproteobacteria bacterium]|nr:16S rRNA (adenine(1518)-N(6)/adenine(1519)-N(6))-dimethyltransferase RsmA [Alphaproteobacteria bacterium]
MPRTDAAISALPPLRDVIAEHGLAARKALGQHFLLDLNLTARIASALGPMNGATVIEVGPGPGGLTRALLSAGAQRIFALEKDRRCREALEPLITAAQGRLTVIEADAMEVDEASLAQSVGAEARSMRLIGNLPYNISTPLIVKWLRQIAADAELYDCLVLTIQKEVADRLTAQPRTKAYGRLSVMCQWLTEPESCFDIAARAFTPPPKVTSSVVRLTPLQAPLAPAKWENMETVTRAAFGQRRKMLRSSLGSIARPPETEALLAHAGIDPRRRAEELDVTEFCALARVIGNRSA